MRAPDATLAAARRPKRAHALRRRVMPLLLLLAASAPTAAFPLTLPQLLQMPLERLLQLRIDAPARMPALPRKRS